MDDDIVVDACCLSNLCAARNLSEWLSTLDVKWHIPTAVLAETVYLRVELDDGSIEKEPVDLPKLVDEGILISCHVEGADEVQLYVDLATQLDDGEAMALAIAKARGWVLSTDDRKAKRLAGEMGVKVLTTPEILKQWEDIASPQAAEMREMLIGIEQRTRFAPTDKDAPYGWWRTRTEDSS